MDTTIHANYHANYHEETRSPAEVRLIALQELATRLTDATESGDACQAVLESGLATLAANAGSVALISGEELLSVRCLGYPPEIVERYKTYSIGANLPIAEAARSAKPIFIESLEERNRRFPQLASGKIPGGRGAMAALPLIAHGEVQGGVLFSFPEDHKFSREEQTFLETLAHLCALAIERVRSEQSRAAAWTRAQQEMAERNQVIRSLAESEHRFATLLRESHDAIGVAADGTILYVNSAFATMLGYSSPDELVGMPTLNVVAEADRPRLLEMARRRALGEAEPNVYKYCAVRKDGTEFDVENRVSLVEQEGQQLTLVIARDVTSRNKRIRAQRFLTEASGILSSSLDYETTLRNVAELAVPQLADWCVIHLLDDSGILQQVAATHVDPEKVEMAREVNRRYPPTDRGSTGVYAVVRSGQSEYMNDIPDELIRAAAKDEEHLKILLGVGMRSYLCVALRARGRALGAITFLGAESGVRFGPDDVTLAEELARRASLAVDNARLYASARREVEERRRAESEVARLNQDLQRRIAEVEALNVRLGQAMTETHHRVKNNLQVIAAMVDMSLVERSGDIPRGEFVRMNMHIRTLAALHDLLTHQAKEDATANAVSTRDLLENIVEMHSMAVDSRSLKLHADDTLLVARYATGLSLVLAELLTNSLKYGKGEILVDFRVTHEARLTVADQGPGFPPNFKPDPTHSTGLELVETIVRWDLAGTICFGNGAEGGALIEIAFPLRSQ